MCPPGRCHLTTLSARSLLLASLWCNVEAYCAKDSAALSGSKSRVLCKKEFMVQSLCSEFLPDSFTLKNYFLSKYSPIWLCKACCLWFLDLSHSEDCFQKCVKAPVKISINVHVTTGFFELWVSALGAFKTLKILKKDGNSEEAEKSLTGTIIQITTNSDSKCTVAFPAALTWILLPQAVWKGCAFPAASQFSFCAKGKGHLTLACQVVSVVTW